MIRVGDQFYVLMDFPTANGGMVRKGESLILGCPAHLPSLWVAEVSSPGCPSWFADVWERDVISSCQPFAGKQPGPAPSTGAIMAAAGAALGAGAGAGLGGKPAGGRFGTVRFSDEDPVQGSTVRTNPPKASCECGSDAVGSPRHSSYCPKATC